MSWVIERETGKGVMEIARFRSPVDALGRLGAMARSCNERFPLRVVSDSSGCLLARWVPDAVDLARADGALASCSASTTATNSQIWDSRRV